MTNPPFVSVIIPAYYSSDTLPECLRALQVQTYQDFEVIVVNSSPETQTSHLMTSHFPEVVFHQHPTRLFPHAARNVGIKLARGDFLVCTDPDCVANSDWLEKLVAKHQAGSDIVGGSHALAHVGWLPIAIHLIKFHWILPDSHAGNRDILPTANVGYARHVLDKTGLFKGEIFVGDAVLAWEAKKSGFQLDFLPPAIVNHYQDDALLKVLQIRYRRGKEFIGERIQFFGWSRLYILLYLLTFWLQPFLVMERAAIDTWQAGWFRRYLMTLPIQYLGHLAWTLGEARGIIDYLTSNRQQDRS